MTLSYAMAQRMRFIDFQLFHYGNIGRLQIIEFFGVTSATATRDFALYAELHPGNAELCTITKRWTQTKEYRRMYP